jgi:hypothetical protein
MEAGGDEITGRRREFYNKEVHKFSAYRSYYNAIIKADEAGGACSRYDREALQSFGRKTCRKRRVTRPRHRWEINIKMDVKEICWESVDCIDLS